MPYFECPLTDCVNHTGSECVKKEVDMVEYPYDDWDGELVCMDYEPREDA